MTPSYNVKLLYSFTSNPFLDLNCMHMIKSCFNSATYHFFAIISVSWQSPLLLDNYREKTQKAQRDFFSLFKAMTDAITSYK